MKRGVLDLILWLSLAAGLGTMLAAGLGCASGELEEGLDASGISAEEVETLECPADPCDADPGAPRAVCLRAQIDACGECRTFYCPDAAISVCQRRCLDPEP